MIEIAVCEEEKKELETISRMLQEICAEAKKECHITVYPSVENLLREGQNIYIGILDVVMPDCKGIELGRMLKERFPGMEVICITSCEDDCRQVVNRVHVFSFLLKPVKKAELKEQLLECMQKISERKREEKLIFEKVRNSKMEEFESVRLDVQEILYCEYIKTKREIAIVLKEEIFYYGEVFEKLAERLKGYGFAVNRRGSIVNLRHIRRLKGYSIYLDNGEELQLTQKRVAEFKEQMNRYFLLNT